MGYLLTRRREMILAASAPSEWDSEWKFANGAPTVKGWVRGGSSGNEAMTATGYRIRGYYYSQDVTTTNGIIEAKFQIINERSSLTACRAMLRIGDANNAVVVAFATYSSSIGIYLNDYSSSIGGSNLVKGTKIGDFQLGGEYTLKLTIDGAVGSAELNGVMLKDDINTAAMYNKGGVFFRGSGDQYEGSIWQYVRFKSLEEST